MMEEIPKKKGNSKELTKKGKIILSIIIGILAIIIFAIIFNTNKLDIQLVITPGITSENMSSYTYNAGNNTDMTIKPNGIVNLKYSYSDDKDYGVNWIVSDESVAKVENNKLVGKKAGVVTIYAVSKKDKRVKSNKVTLTFE